MEREKLDQIVDILNHLEEPADLNKIYQIIGVQGISEEALQQIEDSMEDTEMDQEVRDVISEIETSLKLEDEDYFYDKLESDIYPYIGNDKKKLDLLKKVTDKNDKIAIIGSLQSDEKKIELLNEIEEPEDKARIIKKIQDDEKKLAFLDEIKDSIDEGQIVIVIKSIKNDDQKIKCLDTYSFNSFYKKMVIASLQSDDKKIEAINKLEDDYDKIEIALKMSDEKKVEVLDKLNNEFAKAEIVTSMQQDDDKIKALNKIAGEHAKIKVIASLQDDQKKMNFIKETTSDYVKVQIIKSLKNENTKSKLLADIEPEVIKSLENDDKKIQELDDIEDYYEKLKSIQSLQNDDKKIEALDKIDNIEIVKTLQSDKKKIEALDKFRGEFDKTQIINMIEDDSKKLELLDKLTSDFAIQQVIKEIPKESVSQFIKENEKQSNRKLLLRYAMLDDEILDIIGETYQLKDEQKSIIKDLYAKNDELLETIEYEILDERYSELKDKYLTLTSYTDIQQSIIRLDKNKYDIFVKALKVHEEKNGEWINFTSKIITTMNTNDYDKLIENFQEVPLTEEQIEQLGNIMAQENIFNIENLEEVQQYENIKQTVCDTIMDNVSDDSLQKYPKINELSNIDRMQLAVLMKVYGQTLKETDELIKLYGQDMDHIEVTDENKDILSYMQSLKIIRETQDVDLLKNIYEKSKNIQINQVYDIEFIEKKLKDTYMETFNQKLYHPQEKDFIQTEEVDGKKIAIYDAGTEFGISLTSIGAYYESGSNKNYKSDWNRPKTASQGYCTSYIRNDMLATAPVKNVIYGFEGYEEGTLFLSASRDMWSDARKFKPDARENIVQFLVEDSMINETGKDDHYKYNEMVFSRFNADGTRKQPNYVVFIKETEKLEGKIWENSKKVASQFGIPIVVVDKMKCAEAEKTKIATMMEEFLKNPDEQQLQDIQQKFSNNQNGNQKFFTSELWTKMWEEKGITHIPPLPKRKEIQKSHQEKKQNEREESKTYNKEELKENYEEISQKEKEQGMAELRKRARLIMQEKQKKEEMGEENGQR